DPEAAEALPRALAALQAAADRLRAESLPPGTRALPTDAVPAVHAAQGLHQLHGDGRWHRVSVMQREAPAEVDFRVVPREAPEVYRFCTVRPTGDHALPAGPLQVHVDGSYRTTSVFEGTGGGSPLVMNLGVEPAIRLIERTARVDQQSKGLMGGSTQVDHHVLCRFRSGLDVPAALWLFDRLPVRATTDETDLDITLVDSQPTAEQTDRDPNDERLEGGLRFALDLAPRGTGEVRWHYRLVFPAKVEVSGGNRRE
ncbi:MAG: hypothetical protein KC620_20175, partial [Myxococcales bacterium]|nr:hypothetical protein [Myxococcales bacterium]